MSNSRTADLAKIHIAKKYLGLDDETYRAVLWTCARVKSSKDLDFSGRAAVLKHFESRGWQPKIKAKSKKKVSELCSEPQHKMIRGLWLELYNNGIVINSDESAINRFIKNQTGIEHMQWLNTKQATSIINRLQSWLNRQKVNHVA